MQMCVCNREYVTETYLARLSDLNEEVFSERCAHVTVGSVRRQSYKTRKCQLKAYLFYFPINYQWYFKKTEMLTILSWWDCYIHRTPTPQRCLDIILINFNLWVPLIFSLRVPLGMRES